MEGHTRVHGRTTTCMGKVSTHGVTAGGTMESITWTRSTDMGYITGQMGEDMKDIGEMESNMEKESIYCQME
jgi:hypothetical protein